MRTREMYEELAHRSGLTPEQCQSAYEALVEFVQDELADGAPVRLPGLGTMTVSSRRAFTGVNPANGAAVTIPARHIPVFRAGQQLKDILNPDG